MKKNIVLIALMAVMPFFAAAQGNSQTEELDSDRPDIAQSPKVIPQVTIQLETGIQYQRDKTEVLLKKEFLYPTTLIRIGILKGAELRIGADYKREWDDNGGIPTLLALDDFKGLSDVRLGTKVKIKEGNGCLPEIGFLGNITLPVGDKEFRPPHVAPAGYLLFNNKISDKVDITYNVGFHKRLEDDNYRGEAIYTISGNVKLTDKLTCFAETFSQKPNGKTAEYTADTGLLIKILPNLQFDIIGGIGLNEAAPDAFAGTGLTWRLPH